MLHPSVHQLLSCIVQRFSQVSFPDQYDAMFIHCDNIASYWSELRRFLGMINQFGKFLPHLSELSQPLRELWSSRNARLWCVKQDLAFSMLKNTNLMNWQKGHRKTTMTCDMVLELLPLLLPLPTTTPTPPFTYYYPYSSPYLLLSLLLPLPTTIPTPPLTCYYPYSSLTYYYPYSSLYLLLSLLLPLPTTTPTPPLTYYYPYMYSTPYLPTPPLTYYKLYWAADTYLHISILVVMPICFATTHLPLNKLTLRHLIYLKSKSVKQTLPDPELFII